MCGIVYSQSFNGKPVHKVIAQRYSDQRSRGSDGFGFFVPDTNRLTHHPNEGRIRQLLRNQRTATEILFHHRFPTSTANVRNACHPFSTKDYFDHNYVLVHNGVLWNEHNLKADHQALGIEYISEQEDGSFNDSEALAFDVARYLEGHTDSIEAEGSIAFICIKTDYDGNKIAMYFARNSGNPLVMHKTKDSLTLSSEGEGTLIDTNTLYCYNYATGRITKSFCEIKTAQRYPSYSYSHYGAGYDEDDEFQQIEDYNPSFGYDAYGNLLTDGHGTTFTDDYDRRFRHQSTIKNTKERLLYEANYNEEDAILLGRAEIEQIKSQNRWLIDLAEEFQQASDSQLEQYNSVEGEIHKLETAITELQREVAGKYQSGFQYPRGSIHNKPLPKLEITGNGYSDFAH